MSTLKANTLTGTTSAGSIVVTGEGGSTTTNLQQGLAKAWFHFNGSTATINDSLNGASLTDSGTGQFICNLTSAMSSIEYATVNGSNDNATHNAASDTNQPNSASAYKHNHFENNSETDISGNSNAALGDLA